MCFREEKKLRKQFNARTDGREWLKGMPAAPGGGSGAAPARERVQHVDPRRAFDSCVPGAAGSVFGPIGTTTAAGGNPCSSCYSTARSRAVDGQGTQHAAG